MSSFSGTTSAQYCKPVPRPSKSQSKINEIRSHNRRREFLNKNPGYYMSSEHELADPLLYDTLVRKFQTPAEQEAEGRTKGYSRVLEESLLRGEARLAELAKSSTEDATVPAERAKDFTTESDLYKTRTKEEGLERWNEFLTERFVHGHDEDFDYSLVDHNDDYDTVERHDAEDAWFDAEDPRWASDVDDADGEAGLAHYEKPKLGETGIQDF